MASLVQQIRDLFSKLSSAGSKELIGIDIGAHSIKAAVVANAGKNKFKITHFKEIALGEAVIIEDEVQKEDEVIEAIADVAEGAKAGAVSLGIFGPNTIIKRMQVPDGTKDEIEDHIMWESEQYIPFGVDDSEIVHQVLGENDGGGFEAIMAAARIDLVERFMELIKAANLNVKVVDLNLFALNNYFEMAYADSIEEFNEHGAILIDFGAQMTKVVVYKNGGPVVAKEINIGGVLVTEEIQRQMGVSFEEAEDLKINGDDSGNIPEEFVGIFDLHIEQIIDEIRKSVSYYIQRGTDKIEQCFVTGGSYKLAGLMQALEANLDCEVIPIDPFNYLSFDKKSIDEEDLARIADVGAVAIGLSLRSEG